MFLGQANRQSFICYDTPHSTKTASLVTWHFVNTTTLSIRHRHIVWSCDVNTTTIHILQMHIDWSCDNHLTMLTKPNIFHSTKDIEFGHMTISQYTTTILIFYVGYTIHIHLAISFIWYNSLTKFKYSFVTNLSGSYVNQMKTRPF